MRAITICQPYADAIINGTKRAENRSWYMSYRGPLLIHAGKSKAWLDDPADAKRFVFGAVLGRVEVVDCLEAEKYIRKYGNDSWGCFGPYCIRMIPQVAFHPPIPWRGALGLFDVPDEEIPPEEYWHYIQEGKP